MRKRVVITGYGCISPVGNTFPETWDQIIAGKSGVAILTHFDPTDHKTKFAAEVKGFDANATFGTKEARRMDRYTQFAVASAEEAILHSGIDFEKEDTDRVGVLVGTGIGGIGTLIDQYQTMLDKGIDRVSPFLVPMMISDNAPGLIAIRHGLRGPNLAIATACATGSNAVGEATEIIRRGSADVMIAGAAEAAIIKVSMAGLNSMTALSTHNEDPARASRPFDKDRNGFVMGEGGSMLVLESLEHALARGAKIYCEVTGYGSTDDAYHISAPAENGAGAALCMLVALENANLRPEQIEYINAHGTSTKLNDKSETAAIKQVFGEHAYKMPISSTKSMTGHLLGASGAMEAAFCTHIFQTGMIPPTINYTNPDPDCDLDYVPNIARAGTPKHIMSNSFGFGGHNATIILSRYES